MYSPVKHLSKADKIQAVKQKKKQQLAVLLVNKFRNKFNVVPAQELAIDSHIVAEVQKLLEMGTAQQLALQKLDQTLAVDVERMRARKGTSVTSPKPGLIENTDGVRIGKITNTADDARSNRSRASNAKSVGARSGMNASTFSPAYPTVKQPNPFNGNKLLTFEDPSAALNISEEHWNVIVQKNLRDYEEGNKMAKVKALEKATKVQEEQRKQAEKKRKEEYDRQAKERNDYLTHGMKASDVYYVNEDKKAAKMASLKGGAREVAEDLKRKQLASLDQKHRRMKEDADARLNQMEKIRAEDEAEKHRRMQKKMELRKIMDEDFANKQKFRDRHSQLQARTSDFGDNNVLSYVYTTKEHKSYQLRAKNEKLIGMMKDQFNGQDRAADFVRNIDKDLEATYKKADEVQQKRATDKKTKEMEAKLFQDQQVAAKMAAREADKSVKVSEAMELQKRVAQFQLEDEAKKNAIKKKNTDHLELMKKQMGAKPKTKDLQLVKTGVAIIKGDMTA